MQNEIYWLIKPMQNTQPKWLNIIKILYHASLNTLRLKPLKPIKETIMIPNKLMPWRIAQARIALVTFITLPMRINEQYWKIWSSVMYPEPKQVPRY